MKLRFSIRDLFWLTAFVAVIGACWIDRSQLIAAHGQEWRELLHLDYKSQPRIQYDKNGRIEDIDMIWTKKTD